MNIRQVEASSLAAGKHRQTCLLRVSRSMISLRKRPYPQTAAALPSPLLTVWPRANPDGTRPRPLSCVCSHQQPRIPEYRRRLLASLWRVCSLLFWLAPDPSSTRAPPRRSAAVKAARPGLQRALEDQADDARLVPSRLCFLFLVADGQGFWRLCASTPRGRATPPPIA